MLGPDLTRPLEDAISVCCCGPFVQAGVGLEKPEEDSVGRYSGSSPAISFPSRKSWTGSHSSGTTLSQMLPRPTVSRDLTYTHPPSGIPRFAGGRDCLTTIRS